MKKSATAGTLPSSFFFLPSFSSSSSASQSVSSQTRIGFVGLGNMGLPMSLNLAKHTHHVILAFDSHPNDRIISSMENAGIQQATSVEEIGASQCSIIFTMLPGCDAVDHVTAALLDSIPKNDRDGDASSLVLVDCSTVRAGHPC